MYSSSTTMNNNRRSTGDSSSSSTMTTTQSSSDNEDMMMAMEDHEQQQEDLHDLRRGPWTDEEDLLLTNYISNHGEGRWNSLAHAAGLKRTGKSCRLRWLNYLRPDVRRGNITPEEQLMILELHSQFGNRWSKIAQYLPGRTDNEIKNYWRTRVQKHAKQLRCDVNSKLFKDTMRNVWMPRLAERIQAAADGTSPQTTNAITGHHFNNNLDFTSVAESTNINEMGMSNTNRRRSIKSEDNYITAKVPASSSTADSLWTNSVTTQAPSPVSDLTYDQYQYYPNFESNCESTTTQTSDTMNYPADYIMTSPSTGYNLNHDFNFQGYTTSSSVHEQQYMSNGSGNWSGSSNSSTTQDNSLWDYLWNPNQDIMFLQQQQF
ncbi:hypothetical protein MKW94_020538 [Papaver nudicaule]|uniref:Uncharacterized protein n=1 Tax=Papaver nudicaule TaxID=74823 RepID=A0AA41SN55_PAPNU|nr:hypothetical protein [Papaver nudicaule]